MADIFSAFQRGNLRAELIFPVSLCDSPFPSPHFRAEIRHFPVGRATMRVCKYTSRLAEVILTQLAEGRSLRSICKSPGMPSEAAVRMWAVDNREGFGERLERARAAGCFAMLDEALEIADNAKTSEDAQCARVQVDLRKFALSKLLPKVFGDRVSVDHSVTISIAEELNEVRRRAQLLTAAPVLEALPAPEGEGA